MKTGTLYGVGVGPGDPELLTLKAVRIVQAAAVIAAPVTKPGGDSYALSVVSSFLRPEQRVISLLFPMVRNAGEKRTYRVQAANAVWQELQTGVDVVFLTEGDPLFHSTFIYVLEELPAAAPIEIVPGVSSINAAAAQAHLPLASAGQRLAVVSAVYEDEASIRRILQEFDTVVFLKFRNALARLVDILNDMGLADGAVLVERASHADGRVVRELRAWRGADIDYLSLLIVRTGRKHDKPPALSATQQ